MSELLYAVNVFFKAFVLPGVRVFSTVFAWRMARWFSISTVGETFCGKTLNSVLKSAYPVPGEYIEENLAFCVGPYLHSPAVPRLFLPEPRVSIMPCTEICESPVNDDDCMSVVKGSPGELQNDDTAGYVSGEPDTYITFDANTHGEDQDELDSRSRRSSTYDNQRFEIGHRAPLVPPKQLSDLPPVPTDKLSRKIPPLKRVLSRVFLESGVDGKSSAPMTSIFSKTQHELTHLFTHRDSIRSMGSQGTSSSSYDESSPEVSPSPSPTNFPRLPGVVTVTDVFEHPTHTVTRTVIRPSPSHFLFSLPFKRSSSSLVPKPGSKPFFRKQDSTSSSDSRSTFEDELDASVQRWEDEREGHNPLDIYVVVDREASHEESWRSLVQQVHYNHRPPTRKVSSECGRW